MRGAAKYKESNAYSVRNEGMAIQSSVRNRRGANQTTEKKYMLTKRLIVHAKIAGMKRASQKNFLRLVLMKKVGLQIIMCKRK